MNTGHKPREAVTVITPHRKRPEVWMQLKDPELLAALMKSSKLSTRGLAEAVGWKSHTYIQRLLRGEVRTLKEDKATLISHVLGVHRDILFLTNVTINRDQIEYEKCPQSSRKRAS